MESNETEIADELETIASDITFVQSVKGGGYRRLDAIRSRIMALQYEIRAKECREQVKEYLVMAKSDEEA